MKTTTTTDHAAAQLEIETETRTVEANTWVEAGEYHTAYFRHQPENVKGCPAGRSQHSAAAAISDLLHRTNDESGTAYTSAMVTVTRHNGQPIPSPTPEPEEAAPAPRTLHLRRDPAGQWQYQTREAGDILICWQYGGYDRAETIAQAASRFSFDRVEA